MGVLRVNLLAVALVLLGAVCLLVGVLLLFGLPWLLVFAGALLIPTGLFVVPVREPTL
jgi:protein-S-isoprenylcysteine O-methyltransferase Ste14